MELNARKRLRFGVFAVGCALVFLLLFGLAISGGDYGLRFSELFKGVLGQSTESGQNATDAGVAETIFWQIRLPRVFAALLVGASLAVSGTVMQALFRNSLADPGLLGVSSGAAVGALTYFMFASHLPWLNVGLVAQFVLPAFAVVGGVLAISAIYYMARRQGQLNIASMLLAGVGVNTFAFAVVGLFLARATDGQMRDFTFWSLGSLARISNEALWLSCLFIVISLGLVLCYRQTLNLLLLGEAEAHHLGVDLVLTKRVLILLTSVMVGTSVALCGIIGFVGLVVPHAVRLLLGPDHRWLLPGACLAGGLLLLGADLGAKFVLEPAELPVGVITALLGAPCFLFLLSRSQRG